MTARIAINGFGRIGRLAARAIFETGQTDLELVAINDPGPNTVTMMKYDSVHGRCPFPVERKSHERVIMNGKEVHRFSNRDPGNINWGEYDVDIVLECTGKFKDREGAEKHFASGVKKVLISAPAKDEDITVVYGVNSDDLRAEHKIVSNASCTTNCLAPVAYVLNKEIGIEHGFMTTIHAYTGDQRTVDGSHKDIYRGRAAAVNMIPTSTGAARAVSKVLPELDGRLDGVAIRVPTPNVSLVDLSFVAKRSTSVGEINKIMESYAQGELKGIIGTYDEPLVSGDFNHDPHSSVFSPEGTKVVDGTFVRVMAWYDNEWGFSCRMLDTAAKMHKVGYV